MSTNAAENAKPQVASPMVKKSYTSKQEERAITMLSEDILSLMVKSLSPKDRMIDSLIDVFDLSEDAVRYLDHINSKFEGKMGHPFLFNPYSFSPIVSAEDTSHGIFILESAAKKVAEMMDMPFVVNPGNNYRSDGKEFLFQVLDLSESKTQIPLMSSIKIEGSGEKGAVSMFNPTDLFIQIRNSGFSMVVFDKLDSYSDLMKAYVHDLISMGLILGHGMKKTVFAGAINQNNTAIKKEKHTDLLEKIIGKSFVTRA